MWLLAIAVGCFDRTQMWTKTSGTASFSDALLNRSQRGWVQLEVSISEVMTRWRPKSTERPHAGHPPSAALVIPEHERRLKAGEAKHVLAEEARDLATWFEGPYPHKIVPKIESIENAIRKWRKGQVPQN